MVKNQSDDHGSADDHSREPDQLKDNKRLAVQGPMPCATFNARLTTALIQIMSASTV
jgi:hypothetical protein